MVSKQEAYSTLGLKSGELPKEVEKKYKQLALEWHPQKHNYSALSNQKFKEISKAYVTLTKPKEKRQDDMSMTEMLDLFEKAFFGDENVLSRNDLEISDDWMDDDDDDFYDSDSGCSDDIPSVFSGLVGVLAAEVKLKKESAQKAKQNADELIAEEEKEKRKAAKRKAKKKRRKLKKKQEKNSAAQKNSNDEGRISPARLNESNASASEVEEEGLDPNSAFVAVAVSKSKVAAHLQQKKDKQANTDAGVGEGSVQDVNPQVLQSRELAIRGNMMANIGEYQSAIGLFTDAIKLDPTEFKYFCNRSYCYHQLGHFDRALKDADKAIALQPTWPKGYFRKGQAQTGLQKYVEAEVSFRKVLQLDKNCKEAIQEVKRTQTCQLMELGFSQYQAEQALADHVNLQEATEALLGGAYPPLITNGQSQPHQMHQEFEDDGDEIYMSDEEDRLPVRPPVCQMTSNNNTAASGASASSAPTPLRTIAHLPIPTRAQIAASAKAGLNDFKMDSRNPEGRTSLWVGNVKAQVTEKMLHNLFSKYGELHSIRLLPDRRCAFINYRDRTAAGKAMNSLQGYECCGENLLIRFPDKSHTFGQAFVLKKKGPSSDKTEVKEKARGPVAGDECFFWRTSGCHYGDSCRNRHVKENKGVDNKFK